MVREGDREIFELIGLRFKLSLDETSFEIRAQAGDIQTFTARYEFRSPQSREEHYVGGHGFTGLIYLHDLQKGSYQLYCRSIG